MWVTLREQKNAQMKQQKSDQFIAAGLKVLEPTPLWMAALCPGARVCRASTRAGGGPSHRPQPASIHEESNRLSGGRNSPHRKMRKTRKLCAPVRQECRDPHHLEEVGRWPSVIAEWERPQSARGPGSLRGLFASAGGWSTWDDPSGTGRFYGRSERIRTSGPCLPKTVLYQAELHSVRAADI